MCIANTIFFFSQRNPQSHLELPRQYNQDPSRSFLGKQQIPSSIQDVRAYVGSDHCLCIAVVTMKLKRATSPNEINTNINPKKLNEACVKKKKIQLELSKGFGPLQFLGAETLKERCQHVKNVIVENATKAAGKSTFRSSTSHR